MKYSRIAELLEQIIDILSKTKSGVLESIAVTNPPTKNKYETGDLLDYTGIAVVAAYSDGSKKVVTDSCVFHPVEGKPFDPSTDKQITISYTEDGVTKVTSFSVNDSEVILSNISVTTQPSKTTYSSGESIDYSGAIIMAEYSDGTTKVITGSCTFNPVEGKSFDSATDRTVVVSYSEDGITKTATISLSIAGIKTLTGLAVTTQPTKTSYKRGEAVDYTGLVVTASYNDNSTSNVTDSCVFSAPSGKNFLASTDSRVIIGYAENQDAVATVLNLQPILPTEISVTALPTKNYYFANETRDYTDCEITATYPDSTTAIITQDCEFSPAQGTTVVPITPSEYAETVSVTYVDGDSTFSTSFDTTISGKTLTAISITDSSTAVPVVGQTWDFSEISVIASYSDGTTANVTENTILSPATGDTVAGDGVQTITATYTEGLTSVSQVFTKTAVGNDESFKYLNYDIYGDNLYVTGLNVSQIMADNPSDIIVYSTVSMNNNVYNVVIGGD